MLEAFTQGMDESAPDSAQRPSYRDSTPFGVKPDFGQCSSITLHRNMPFIGPAGSFIFIFLSFAVRGKATKTLLQPKTSAKQAPRSQSNDSIRQDLLELNQPFSPRAYSILYGVFPSLFEHMKMSISRYWIIYAMI